jgi:serine/threonine-protein kinase
VSRDSSESHTEAVIRTLLLSDLVGSTELLRTLGDLRAASLFAQHDHLARALLAEHDGREIDKTDGFLLLFDRPINAVLYALEYHRALVELGRDIKVPIAARIGVHLGEVMLRENPAADVARGAKPVEVEGLAKPLAARIMSLAAGGQTLITRGAFDLARRAAVDVANVEGEIQWLAHGGYLPKGMDEPIEVFEVGITGEAPLKAPPDSDKVRRVIGDGTITGWRPGPGLDVPERPHWRIEDKLGEGGFGEAWLAKHGRTGEARVFKFCYDATALRGLKRETALFTLLKNALGHREDLARILDWNFDAPPYFIESEYTEGGSLLRWADAQGGIRNVPLDVRLDIVAQVADALAAAHSVGVLHKDIKPGNILIGAGRDGKPNVRLLDFGIGRVTDEEKLRESGIEEFGMTEIAAANDGYEIGGTRLYLAPEIVEGKPATLQADIYSLGVLLYQMVVADFSRSLAPGWQRDVENPLLREDIEWAVDGSPEKRLSDARQLAERLRTLPERTAAREQWLRDEAAAKELRAALERSRRRRKILVAALSIVSIFAGTTLYQARQTALEADRANREADVARRTAEFLVDLFKVSDPSEARGNTITAREILDRSAVRIERELTDQPQVQAKLMDTMGKVYRSLGLYEEAQPLIEGGLARRRELLGEDSPEVAESLANLGEVLVARAHLDEAEARQREALELRKKLFGERDLLVAESLQGLAGVLSAKGDYTAAGKLLDEALGIRRETLPAGDPLIGASLEALALGLVDQGDLDAPLPLLEESLEIRREAFGDPHPDVAAALNNLAFVLYRRGDYERAEESFRAVLAMQRKLLKGDHPELATALSNVAFVLQDRGEYDAAEGSLREAIEMQRRIYKGPHPDLARSYNNLAFLLSAKGDISGSIEASRAALDMNRAVYGESHPSVAQSLSSLGRLTRLAGNVDEAERLFRRALDLRKELLGESHPDTAWSMTALADVLEAGAQYQEGLELATRAREIFADTLPADHWRSAVAMSVEGACLAGLGRFPDAHPLLVNSVTTLQANPGATAELVRDALRRTIAFYDRWERPQEAAKYRTRLAQIGS